MNSPLIEIRNLKKTYIMGDTVVPALRGVSLSIDAGEFLAIMGPSGSGKSTLMHLLGLLDAPDSGSYQLGGQEISRLSEDEYAALRGQTIGFVFQQFNLLSRTSALENVALPLIYSGQRNGSTRPKELLEQVGLAGRILHKPNELSGGQQQRVAIARALVNRPRIVFADEPTGNLDSRSQEEIMALLEMLNAQGITIVMVTHEEEVAAHARRVIRMRDGLVLSDHQVQSKYDSGAVQVISKPQAQTALSSDILLSPAPYSLSEISEHFRQAGRSLAGNKVRTGLSMLGILIGVASVIAMLALGSGAKQSIEKQLSSMGSNLLVLRSASRRSMGVSMQAGEVTRITLEDADKIKSEIEEVSRVAPSVQGRAQIVFGNRNWNTQIQGTSPDYAFMRAAQPVLGRFFTEEENQRRSRVIVLGQTVARELFGEQSPIGEMVKVNKIGFQVIGILPEKGATAWRDQDDLAVIPVITAMRRVLGKDFVDSVDIEVKDAESLEPVQEKVNELVMRLHRLPPSQKDSFDVRNMAELQAALTETSRTMTWLLGSIAAVSLLVGGIGIMNIMLVSVTERTREIGLRKAIGAKKRDILSQFLVEAIVVSVAGGALGILLGVGISVLLTQVAGWATHVSWQSVALSAFFSITVGVVFGLWPARKAASLNPIDALRYE